MFSQAHTFNIDEFVGLQADRQRSFCAFMQKHLFSRINLPAAHVHFLKGTATDHQAECERFEREKSSRSAGLTSCCSASARQRTHRLQRARAGPAGPQPPHRTGDRNPPCECAMFGGRLDRVPREKALTMGVERC
jgi:hypothetical protein